MPIQQPHQPPPVSTQYQGEERRSQPQYGARARKVSLGSSSNPSSPFKSPLKGSGGQGSTSARDSIFSLRPSASSRTPSPTKRAQGEEDMDIEARVEYDNQDEEESDSDDDQDSGHKPVVHIEARMQSRSTRLVSSLRPLIDTWLEEDRYLEKGPIAGWEEVHCLGQHLASITLTDMPDKVRTIRRSEVDIQLYVYKFSDEEMEQLSVECSDDEDDEASPAGSSCTSLPSRSLDRLWDNLIYPGTIKEDLIRYVNASAVLSDLNIDPTIVNWNRLILLHGPPGTGKTSLCKALAQKIAIRLTETYPFTKLVEINSHSLFSKWFSESGKLVQKLFSQVTEMVNSDSTFVIVMIDEVESLTSSRSASGSEPGDAMRVVNALLTQLDKLKACPNVLVMTTSNLSQTIDPAFLDRADFKEYIPLPPPEAVYWMLRTSFIELMSKGAMRQLKVHDWALAKREHEKATRQNGHVAAVTNGHRSSSPSASPNGETRLSKEERAVRLAGALATLAHKCHEHQISGRTLRRMPLMALSRYLSQEGASRPKVGQIIRPYSPERWLEALSKVVDAEHGDRVQIGLVKHED